MRIVTHKSIENFYKKHTNSKSALEEWYTKANKAEWNNFAEMKSTFKSVDAVGNNRFVFNVKGNDYRLVAIVLFQIKIIYIRFIGTHAEYDKIDCENI
jgi:mRNA interferase HigB